MDLLRAVVLGIVQGLTEFLPISSSGHLILISRLFNWEDQGLSFDVGLHVGTLIALLVYFWRDWARMIGFGLVDLRDHQFRFARHRSEARLIWLIALGSLPAAIVGLLFESWIEEHVRQPWLVAITLASVGAIMLFVDRRSRRTRGIESIGLMDAVTIGAAQACALIPGVSRSGATMSMGLFRDLDREAAARFAFLLGTPAFVGAALLKVSDFGGESSRALGELAIGLTSSAVVGLLVIHFLMRYLRTRSLLPFVVYRWGVAALTLIIAFARTA
jgi:undecaprenyl-diphosphatase